MENEYLKKHLSQLDLSFTQKKDDLNKKVLQLNIDAYKRPYINPIVNLEPIKPIPYDIIKFKNTTLKLDIIN